MKAIYSAFYKHWEREDRSALETFLTRALCDLLARLTQTTPNLVESFVLDLLLAPRRRTTSQKSLDRVKRRLATTTMYPLKWDDEVPIRIKEGRRRPDICLRAGNEPLLVIENKVTARLSALQLESYGKWLARENPGADPGTALIFLTHTTLPPADFLKPGRLHRYGVPLRSVCSWIEIYDWLGRRGVNSKDAFTGQLASELRSFMEDHHLNDITEQDVPAVHKLLSAQVGDKIGPFFTAVRKPIQPRMEPRYRFEKQLDIWNSTEGRGVWDWCYYKRPANWFIAWGLSAGFYESPPHDSLLALLVVDHEGDPRIPLEFLPKSCKATLKRSGWKVDYQEGHYLKTENALKLASCPGGFTPAFIRWLEGSITDAEEILDRSQARFISR